MDGSERLAGLKSEVTSHRTAFPDWSEKVDDIIAEGDRAVIRFTSSGTQRGEFAGIAPHGEKVTSMKWPSTELLVERSLSSGVFQTSRASCGR